MNVILENNGYQECDVSPEEYIMVKNDLIVPMGFLFKFDAPFKNRFAYELMRTDKQVFPDERGYYGRESAVLVYEKFLKVWVFCYQSSPSCSKRCAMVASERVVIVFD